MKHSEVKKILVAINLSCLTENEAVALFDCVTGTNAQDLAILLECSTGFARTILTKLVKMEIVHKRASLGYVTSDLGQDLIASLLSGKCPEIMRSKPTASLGRPKKFIPPLPPAIPKIP